MPSPVVPQEARHTPGPWHRNIKPATKYNTVWSGRNTHVLRMVVDGLPPEEVEANICVATASPELLAACRAVIDFIEGKPDAPEPFGIVRAAITKATGTPT